MNTDLTLEFFLRFMKEPDLFLPLSSHCKLPSTCQSSSHVKPIDGILCLIGLHPAKSGYIPSCLTVSSDHISAWADIPFRDVFGATGSLQPLMDCLNIQDPRVVARYNNRSFSIIEAQDILPSLQALSLIEADAFDDEHIARYNDLVSRITNIRKQVKKKSRHLYTGHHPWSPEFTRACKERLLWIQVIRYKERFKCNPPVKSRSHILRPR